jgi:probable HAF family extracellular repeat protein
MLPLPGDSHFGLAFGISNARTVVGIFEAQDATIRCFQWTEQGGSIDLGFMGAGDHCEALDVNGAGQITGEATIGAERLPHAFIYSAGAFHDLGVLAAGDRSLGVAINTHGDVAGRASVPPLDGMHFHAAKWPAGGQVVDLDPHGKYFNSVANGINDAGEVVGTVTIDATGNLRAVRFDGHHAVLLQTEVLNLDGWTLEQAADVNAKGEIVGVGVAPDGRSHGFLLRPSTTIDRGGAN